MTSGTLERSAAYWNQQAASEERWSAPVDAAVIARARKGDWSIILTPDKAVPRSWFPSDLTHTRLLALAGSGGQQAPVLAAAGAQVTVFDLSEGQLDKDQQVAVRDGLDLRIEQGDMADLSRFADNSFDLVVNPCSVCFVAEVEPVWREAARVLRPGGRLMSGFINPLFFMFDHDTPGADRLKARFPLPYDSTNPELRDRAEALGVDEFSHSLDTLMGGQMRAGLQLIDMYEDNWSGADLAIDAFTPLYIATLAQKPA